MFLGEYYAALNMELINRTDLDPFALSTWIQHVVITIHPFEDGNGRLSRILGSIPLTRARLPPLAITSSIRLAYLEALNAIRAAPNRAAPEAYHEFISCLFGSSQAAIEALLFIRNQPANAHIRSLYSQFKFEAELETT
ncbi:hypothetical protein EUX98_g8065 [Antrodiella citrinella]|uniref:Fido domain-containing protein n=1 Tax=Antrodiella citrinella TaxID=2447956 RepID=A0A4S4MCA3_9APHY|nr:hypothetical protein EUX98_g8065 [Antrodiella citrinella]